VARTVGPHPCRLTAVAGLLLRPMAEVEHHLTVAVVAAGPCPCLRTAVAVTPADSVEAVVIAEEAVVIAEEAVVIAVEAADTVADITEAIVV
jgi:hypothetical protein